jgi:hypothetical protein
MAPKSSKAPDAGKPQEAAVKSAEPTGPVAAAVVADPNEMLETERFMQTHTVDEFQNTFNIKTQRHSTIKNLQVQPGMLLGTRYEQGIAQGRVNTTGFCRRRTHTTSSRDGSATNAAV